MFKIADPDQWKNADIGLIPILQIDSGHPYLRFLQIQA